MFERAIPPDYCSTLWKYYWDIRNEGVLRISEVLAYKQITGATIDEYELNEMLLIDRYAQSREAYHRNN